MKKIIFIILIVSMLAISLTACNLNGGNAYSQINELLKDDFSHITLDVETTANGITLVNKYSASIASNTTIVTYSMQSLAEIEKDEDGNYIMPTDMIVTEKGSATINNGKITFDGKETALPEITSPSLNFNKQYLSKNCTKVVDESNVTTIIADVIDIKGFTGNSNFDGKDMKVEVVYGESIKSIVINYTMNSGATVKVTYTFA